MTNYRDYHICWNIFNSHQYPPFAGILSANKRRNARSTFLWSLEIYHVPWQESSDIYWDRNARTSLNQVALTRGSKRSWLRCKLELQQASGLDMVGCSVGNQARRPRATVPHEPPQRTVVLNANLAIAREGVHCLHSLRRKRSSSLILPCDSISRDWPRPFKFQKSLISICSIPDTIPWSSSVPRSSVCIRSSSLFYLLSLHFNLKG